MRVLLHIGVWKTGSSAIQGFLIRNREALRARGLVWPRFAMRRHGQNAVVRALRMGDGAQLDALIGALAGEARGATGILSSEHFWALDPPLLRRLRRRLAAHGAEARVLAYIRPQEEMWASLYAQQAKALRITSDTPLWGDASYLGRRLVERGLYFGAAMATFRRIFGEVELRRYDRARLSGGDAVVDFLGAAGLDDLSGLDLSETEANPSFGWKGVGFAMWCAEATGRRSLTARDRILTRRLLRETVRDMRDATGDPDWLGAAPVFLSGEERLAIRAHYAADEARLSAAFFGGAPVWKPLEPATPAPHGPNALPTEELAAARRRLETRLTRNRATRLAAAIRADS